MYNKTTIAVVYPLPQEPTDNDFIKKMFEKQQNLQKDISREFYLIPITNLEKSDNYFTYWASML